MNAAWKVVAKVCMYQAIAPYTTARKRTARQMTRDRTAIVILVTSQNVVTSLIRPIAQSILV